VASSIVTTDPAGNVVTVPVTVITPIPNAPASNPGALVTAASSVVVTDSRGNVATVPVQVISPATPTPAPAVAVPVENPPASSSSTSSGSGGSGSGGDAGEVGQAGLNKAAYTTTITTTFSGGYAPIIVARVFHWSWQAVHAQLIAYEPFAQMNQPGGAPGTVLLGPSISSMWYSWAGYAAVVILTPLAPEVLFFDTNYGCSNPNTSDKMNPCWPAKVSTNMPIIRSIEVLLGIVAVLAAVAAAKSFKKPSGVTADPTSIAAVASVMSHPQVLKDFAMLSGEATEKDLKSFLETKKYKLGTYVTENGTERYGIIPVETGDSSAPLDLAWSPNGEQTTPIGSETNSKWSFLSMWKSVSMYIDGIFLLFIIAVLCICGSYLHYVDRSVLAKIFQFSSIGRRIVFTVIGLIVSSNWGRLLQGTKQNLTPGKSPY
jgi:hypothetical protein